MDKKTSDTDKDFIAVRVDFDKPLTLGHLRNAILFALQHSGSGSIMFNKFLEGLTAEVVADHLRDNLINMIRGMSSKELNELVERIRDKP